MVLKGVEVRSLSDYKVNVWMNNPFFRGLAMHGAQKCPVRSCMDHTKHGLFRHSKML